LVREKKKLNKFDRRDGKFRFSNRYKCFLNKKLQQVFSETYTRGTWQQIKVKIKN
jgi:hypothetical protein